MAISANMYANVFDQALQGAINWPSDTIKMALLGSGYSPSLSTHIHWSDVSGQEISGTGYTTGGATLGTKTHSVTAANSWGTTWAASTAFATGAVVRPTTGNGFIYMAESGGTSGASAPTWPTVVGATVVDSGVTWTCVGESISQLSSASVQWTSATISANYAVIYDAQSGSASTEPLIALINFGGAVSSTASTFTVNPNTLGWAWISPA